MFNRITTCEETLVLKEEEYRKKLFKDLIRNMMIQKTKIDIIIQNINCDVQNFIVLKLSKLLLINNYFEL